MRRGTATVFDGGSLYLPLVKGKADPKIGPHCVELELPIGLSLYLPVEFANVSDVSAVPGGGPVAQGYYRVRITNANDDYWGYLNWDVKLRIRVAPALLQGGRRTFSGSRARAFSGAANQARADNWQPWILTVVNLVPTSQLPKRLTTGFCWDGAAEFGTFCVHCLYGTDALILCIHICTCRCYICGVCPEQVTRQQTSACGGNSVSTSSQLLVCLSPHFSLVRQSRGLECSPRQIELGQNGRACGTV